MAQVSNVKISLANYHAENSPQSDPPAAPEAADAPFDAPASSHEQPGRQDAESSGEEPDAPIAGLGEDLVQAPVLPSGSAQEEQLAGEPAAFVVMREDGNFDVNLQPWMSAGLAGIQSVAESLIRQRAALQNDRGVPVDFVLKVAGLLGVRRFSMRSFHIIEALSYALPLPCRALPWKRAKAVGALAGGMVKAVITSRAIGVADLLLERLLQRRRHRRHRGAAPSSPATPGTAAAGSLPVALSDGSAEGEGSLPPTPTPSGGSEKPYLMRAAVVASLHKSEMQEMKEILQSKGAALPLDRFNETDSELCRFAAAYGLVKGRKGAVQKGARMVMQMVEWRQAFPFLGEDELQEWNHLVRFCGADEMGRPVLLLLLGRALVSLPRTKESWNRLCTAIITNVDLAVQQLLTDEVPGPEHITVVLDAGGCSNVWQIAGAIHILKQVVATLTDYYPARLARLYVVDLPFVFAWIFKAVKAFLHPATKQKLIPCSSSDSHLLPFDMASVRAPGAAQAVLETPHADEPLVASEEPQEEPSVDPAGGDDREEYPDPATTADVVVERSILSANPQLPARPRRRSRGQEALAEPSQRRASRASEPEEEPAQRRTSQGAEAASASPPVVPKLHLQPRRSSSHDETPGPVPPAANFLLTPRALRSDDLTTVLYIIIAIAACTFIGQQAGIDSRQMMAALDRLGANMAGAME